MKLLKNRNMRLLWMSQIISQVGNRMFQLATIWWIIGQEVDNKGVNLAILLILSTLPSLLLNKKIGHVIDTYPGKKVLITSDSIGLLASIIFFMAFYNWEISLPFLFFLSFLYSLCQSFIEPTLNKAVPEIVDDDNIERAVAFVASTQPIASFAGAIAGAVLIEILGLEIIIILNGATYLVSIFCDYQLKLNKIERPVENEASGHNKLNILKQYPLIKKVLIGFGVVNFFATPVILIVPLYLKNILDGSAFELGVLESALWLGMLLGTFTSDWFPLKKRPVLFCSFSLLSFGVFLTLPGLIVDRIFYFFFLLFGCYCLGLLNVRILSYFQKEVAHHHKGRFFALLQAIISCAIPCAHLVFGVSSSYTDIRNLCIAQGIGVFIMGLYFINLHLQSLNYNNSKLSSGVGHEV